MKSLKSLATDFRYTMFIFKPNNSWNNGNKAIEGNSWSFVSDESLAILISPHFTIYRFYRFIIFPFSVLDRISISGFMLKCKKVKWLLYLIPWPICIKVLQKSEGSLAISHYSDLKILHYIKSIIYYSENVLLKSLSR